MAFLSVKEAQIKLAAFGQSPGPIDGILGRKTQAAIRAFQAAAGIEVSGVLDPETVAALTGRRDIVAGFPWMVEAERVRGLREARDNARLFKWLKSDGATVGDPAKIPWCGDFVQTAIALALPNEPIPANPYLAANWVKFGQATTPQRGAVLSFWRGSPDSWKGHVGFYAGEDATHFLVLGGNQSNSVSLARIEKRRLRRGGARWPSTYPDPRAGAVRQDLGGVAVTHNEA